MFRRFVASPMARLTVATFLVLVNMRLPFIKLYFKISLAALALLVLDAAVMAQDPSAYDAAGCVSCGPAGCQRFHCPPVLKWCMEGAPRICFQHGCPKPICNPCEAPNWGYYQKCWAPWPWAPDWSHCPVPPPAAHVYPGMIPAGQPSPIDLPGPQPRRLDARSPF